MKEIINYGEARRQQILKGFTNIEECIEEAPIEKARHGVYADNAQNRRLQRVGQEYGHAAQEKPEAGQEEGGVPEGNVSLQNHARQASEEALVKVANDPSADAEMRKVATAELERRGVNVRAKNKKGDQSLRNGLADGDAKSASTFEAMGFRQMDDEDLAQYAGVEDAAHAFIKQVGGDEDGFDLVVTKTSEGYRVDKYPYADVDNFESVTVKKIEDVEGAASKFGDPDAKGGKADAKSLVDSFYSAMEDEGDFDAKSFKSYVKEKGGKVVKELAAAIGNLPSETMSSDPDDEEIAAEIESMFKEAGMRVPREVKKELDKLQGSAEGVVDKWNAYLEEEDGGEDFADSLQSLVDKKSDAKVVKELAEAFRNLPAETMSSDPDDEEIAAEIESMFKEAGMRVPREVKKELDKLQGSAEGVVDKWNAYLEEEDGGEDFADSLQSLVDKKSDAKVVKELAEAFRNLPAETMSSDPDDGEIADEIANMFEEAGVTLSKKGQAALDKMRDDSDYEENADDAGELVRSFDDMAENDTDFDSAGFKSFVKKKGDAAAIKALARYIRENPLGGNMESELDDDEIAEVIENMYAEAGVKVSEDGQKELDALRGGQKESDTKQAEKAERAKKAAAADKASKAKGAKLDATLKTVESVDKMVKDVFNEDNSKKFLKNFLKDPEAHAKVLSQRIKSGDKKTAADAQYVANRIAGIIMDPVSRSRGEGVGQEIGNHPELKKFIDANDEANNIKWNQFGMDKEESRRLFDEKRKKMDAARKGFVSKFLEIYGGNTEE